MSWSLLEQFQHPMLLVDSQRGIRYRNAVAVAELAAAGCLLERQGLLAARDADSDARLQQTLQSLDLPNPTARAPSRRFTHLHNTVSGRRIGMHALAVRAPAATGKTPLALLLLHDPMQYHALDPEDVAEAFGFSPAEAKVAVKLAQGLTSDQISAINGVSIATVRTQIQSIFLKTGTSRQIEVVRLVTSMLPFGLAVRASA